MTDEPVSLESLQRSIAVIDAKLSALDHNLAALCEMLAEWIDRESLGEWEPGDGRH